MASDRKLEEAGQTLAERFVRLERSIAALGNVVQSAVDEIEDALSALSEAILRKWAAYERRRLRAEARSRRNNDEMRRRGKTR